MKKTAAYQPKRVTLLSLIIKAVIAVLVLTLAFGICFRTYLDQAIYQQGRDQISEQLKDRQQDINKAAVFAAPEYRMQEIRAELLIRPSYEVIFEDPIFGTDWNSGLVEIYPRFSKDCHSAAVLLDEEGNIVVSGKRTLLTYITYGKDDPATGFYVCDKEALGMPMIDQLYADFEKLAAQEDMITFVRMDLTSAYINRETHTFIPHEGVMRLMSADYSESPLSEEIEVTSQDIRITIPEEGYELVELHALGSETEFPKCAMTNFYGETQAVLDRFNEIHPFTSILKDHYVSNEFQALEDDSYAFCGRSLVYIDEKPYTLQLHFIINSHDPKLVLYYWHFTLLFAGIVTLIAALLVWRRYMINKARYDFEDYQRDLTNHLAHDIKTPLMAIGGYAENILESGLTAEEQQRYLSSILENVAYTDSIISRTLQLNGQQKPRNPEKIAAEKLLQEVLGKYAALLESKGISCKAEGSAEIMAERADLQEILENLVSNAVKYTPENGEIRAVLDGKSIVLTNTVTERIDTRKLTEPFYRGDAARSNSQGSGLGLSIAERAAQANGGKLSLSCTETQFRAEVRF